ncbi:MAG: J domain-containing protein [Treponemataceae bacterium]|nr:J domain-containing protein [Treponemataceae bacterium]
MNSMFDRLGDFLRDYIDEDDQDIFSSPQEQIEKEKSTQNFSQDNQSTEKEKNAYTTEKIKTEKSKEKFTFTQKETETKTEFKFDKSKQQSEFNTKNNSQSQKFSNKKTEQQKASSKQKKQTTGKRYYVPFELYEDFKTLCVMPGTNLDECKTAYKSLLKQFHPDKFANEPEKQKEATEITSSITSAFTRIKTWYEENLPKS